MNLVGFDENQSPVVMSIKNEHMAGQDHTRILLRLRTETMHGLIPTTSKYKHRTSNCNLSALYHLVALESAQSTIVYSYIA